MLNGIVSCDYISDPYEHLKPDVDGSLCPDPVFPAQKAHRTVLVEDFTGHQCTACPQAAKAAAKLEDLFKDSVIIVAVHAGHFAAVKKPDYAEDFTTEAGTEYNTKFDFQAYPNGLINRINYPQSPIKSFGSWSAEVSKQLKIEAEADIQLTSDYNSADSNVCIGVQTKFLSASIPSGTYKLVVQLTQDSIIAPQLDGGVYKPTYLHRHMLKDNINGTWGDELLTGTVTLAPIVRKYKYKVKHDYKGIVCLPKDCHLVAYVYDNSNYRILQAAEIKLIP